jgi:preprotein translocase subunit SecA
MAGPSARGDPGFYPERQPAREPPFDWLAGEIGFRAQQAFARTLSAPASLAGDVERHAARFRATPLAGQVPELRYRLRRDGLAGDRLAECFGLYLAAMPVAAEPPSPDALTGAAALVAGGIVDIGDARARWHALALAATAFALCGVPVHLVAASEARSLAAAELLRVPLAALGLGAAAVTGAMSGAERRVAYGAAVTCGTHRVLGFDYLRDRLQLGRRLRPMQSRLERLSGDTTAGANLLHLTGLHCALVEDADQVLLDDARQPLTISADAETSADRLPYEQALELAKSLEAGADYVVEAGQVRLAGRGQQRVAQLSLLLGGLWAARQQREELVSGALAALQLLERGRDYDVAQGMLQLPAPAPGQAPVPEPLQRFLEVKEDLSFGGRRDVLARLPVPLFFRRYLRLAGSCADARGLEAEFWSAYGLRSTRAGWPATTPPSTVHGFLGSVQRRAAILEAVRAASARGQAVVVALRTGTEAAALAGEMQQAGLRFVVLRGGPAPEDRAALAALDRPGTVALSLHPAQRGVARSANGEVPLHLVVAEALESARHVVQAARSYAAASCEQFFALEDEGFDAALGPLGRRLARFGQRDGVLAAAAAARAFLHAQQAFEQAARRGRRELQAREQTMDELLAFSGRPE